MNEYCFFLFFVGEGGGGRRVCHFLFWSCFCFVLFFAVRALFYTSGVRFFVFFIVYDLLVFFARGPTLFSYDDITGSIEWMKGMVAGVGKKSTFCDTVVFRPWFDACTSVVPFFWLPFRLFFLFVPFFMECWCRRYYTPGYDYLFYLLFQYLLQCSVSIYLSICYLSIFSVWREKIKVIFSFHFLSLPPSLPPSPRICIVFRWLSIGGRP